MPEALVKPGKTERRRDGGTERRRDGATIISLSLRPSLSLSFRPSISPSLHLYISPSLCLSVSPSLCLFVFFDGAHERAADGRGHSRIRPMHRHPDDLVEFDVGKRIFLVEIPSGRLLRAGRIVSVPLGQVVFRGTMFERRQVGFVREAVEHRRRG